MTRPWKLAVFWLVAVCALSMRVVHHIRTERARNPRCTPKPADRLAGGLHRRRVATGLPCRTTTPSSGASLWERSARVLGTESRAGACLRAAHPASRRASQNRGHSRSPRPGHRGSRTPTCRTACPARSPTCVGPPADSVTARNLNSTWPVSLRILGLDDGRRTTPRRPRERSGPNPSGPCADSSATIGRANRPARLPEGLLPACCRSRIASRPRRRDRRR